MTANRLATPSDFSLEGHLLVAAPAWESKLFNRSVCLVVHHSPEGAVGVFLNRCVDFDTGVLWQQLTGSGALSKHAAIHFGGPQSGPVVAVHNRADLAEYTSGEGVYFAAQLPHLQQLLKLSDNAAELKIIVGQADWPAGELDEQFRAGHWLPLPVLPKLVFADGSRMWAQAIREVGNRVVASMTGAHGQPHDILSN